MPITKVLSTIDSIYDTVGNPESWPNALEKIALALDAKSAALFTQSDDGVLVAVATPNIGKLLQEYNENWSRQDIAMQRAIEYSYSKGVDVVRDELVITPHERASHPFFVDFLRRNGLGTLMSASVSPSPRTLVRLAVQGAAERRLFDEADAKLMEALARHCERALMLSCRLGEQHIIAETLGEAIARFNCGVFLIDAQGKVVSANVAGQSILGNGIQIVAGRLNAREPGDRAALDGAITSALRSSEDDRLACSRPVMLRRDDGRRPLVAHVVPLRSQDATQPWAPLQETAALCIVTDIELQPEIDASLVRDFLGLTLGEARIAAQIGTGKTPRDAAKHLEISEETVRTVLKRVFSKTGTSRQSELAALLARLQLVDIAKLG